MKRFTKKLPSYIGKTSKSIFGGLGLYDKGYYYHIVLTGLQVGTSSAYSEVDSGDSDSFSRVAHNIMLIRRRTAYKLYII